MLEDVYVEQLFPTKAPKTLKLLYAIILLIAVMAAGVIFWEIPYIILIYCVLALLLLWYMKDALRTEYEYSLINSDFSVAIVYSKKRRSLLYEVDLLKLQNVQLLEKEEDWNKAKQRAAYDFTPGYFTEKYKYYLITLSQADVASPSLWQRSKRLKPFAAEHCVLLSLDEHFQTKIQRYFRRVHPNKF